MPAPNRDVDNGMSSSEDDRRLFEILGSLRAQLREQTGSDEAGDQQFDRLMEAFQHATRNGARPGESGNLTLVLNPVTDDGDPVSYEVLGDDQVAGEDPASAVTVMTPPSERVEPVFSYLGFDITLSEVERVWAKCDRDRDKLTDREEQILEVVSQLLSVVSTIEEHGEDFAQHLPPDQPGKPRYSLLPTEVAAEFLRVVPVLRNRLRMAVLRNRSQGHGRRGPDHLRRRQDLAEQCHRRDEVQLRVAGVHQREPRIKRAVAKSNGGGSSGDKPPPADPEPSARGRLRPPREFHPYSAGLTDRPAQCHLARGEEVDA